MGFGPAGKIMRINLTEKNIKVEHLPESFYRLYPGGKALAGYFLFKEMSPGVDPFSPANLLVIANGLLTGSPLSTATRFTTAARSPLTGGYGEAEAGGFWGPELRNAGWDAVLVTGKAENPVYIFICDDDIQIKPADHLWGRDPDEVQSMIREETGEKMARVLQIGKGGENLVRYACIGHEMRHFNGRNGIGAVMGSKNLRAVVVRGHGRYSDNAFDGEKVATVGKKLVVEAKTHPISRDMQERGTPGLVGGLNAAGILPTYNFKTGAFPEVDEIKWEAYEEKILTARKSCYACAIRCKREISLDDKKTTSNYGGPEYESMAAFGSNMGISDIKMVAKANELCNRYSLDTISTGMTIAFAMECFEHELLNIEDTGGIELRFGNAEAMLQMIDMIANREGIGNLLAEGSYRAAQVIGGDAPFFSISVKKQELAMHDPRGKVAVGLGFAICETGADHIVSYHDTMFTNPDSAAYKGAIPLGYPEPLPARELSDKKVRQYFIGENWSSFEKSVGFCYFGPAPRSFIQVEDVLEIMRAATGWDLSIPDLLVIGERATNLARIFNIREGFTPMDDRLPDRLFTPLETGALAGVAIDQEQFEEAMKALYSEKQWDIDTGKPTRQRLKELDIEWAADKIGA
ncbi:MAG: aldehyde ferredoxin oxidoreductase family protein [Anaerolineales bacterium]|nr:aldehyde ferredoxin oxidoreductase family protein [Anaerolineales bacterium]